MANTKFYFIRKDNEDSYELSSTTNVRVSQPAIASKKPTEAGKSLTDNYYLDNKTVTFNGVITNINNSSSVEDTQQWLYEIESLRAEVPPVLLDVYADNVFVSNCLIVTLDIDKSKQQGLGGWMVNIVLQEVDFTERAKLIEIPEPLESQEDNVDPKKKKSSNTTKEVPLAETSLVKASRGLSDFVTGSPQIEPNTDVPDTDLPDGI